MNDGAPRNGELPPIVDPGPDAGIITVLMVPTHFRRYQEWLLRRGQKVVPMHEPETFMVTLIDWAHGVDPDRPNANAAPHRDEVRDSPNPG